MVKIVKESKKDLVDNAGYDEIVIEDFHETFLENLEKMSKLKEELATKERELDEAESRHAALAAIHTEEKRGILAKEAEAREAQRAELEGDLTPI